jgi:hypothetical protein
MYPLCPGTKVTATSAAALAELAELNFGSASLQIFAFTGLTGLCGAVFFMLRRGGAEDAEFLRVGTGWGGICHKEHKEKLGIFVDFVIFVLKKRSVSGASEESEFPKNSAVLCRSATQR